MTHINKDRTFNDEKMAIEAIIYHLNVIKHFISIAEQQGLTDTNDICNKLGISKSKFNSIVKGKPLPDFTIYNALFALVGYDFSVTIRPIEKVEDEKL